MENQKDKTMEHEMETGSIHWEFKGMNKYGSKCQMRLKENLQKDNIKYNETTVWLLLELWSKLLVCP